MILLLVSHGPANAVQQRIEIIDSGFHKRGHGTKICTAEAAVARNRDPNENQ